MVLRSRARTPPLTISVKLRGPQSCRRLKFPFLLLGEGVAVTVAGVLLVLWRAGWTLATAPPQVPSKTPKDLISATPKIRQLVQSSLRTETCLRPIFPAAACVANRRFVLQIH